MMRRGTQILIRGDVVPLAVSESSVVLAGVDIIHEYLPCPTALYSGYIVRGTEMVLAYTELMPPDRYGHA